MAGFRLGACLAADIDRESVVVVVVRTRVLACVRLVFDLKLDHWVWLLSWSDLDTQAALLSMVTEFSVTCDLVGVVLSTSGSQHSVIGKGAGTH